jgi:hypothetical protein
VTSVEPASQGPVVGQKYAFATASLVTGIACYVNLLGLEKALLAILFAWLALKSSPAPALTAHRGWAKTGLVLGIIPWLLLPPLLIWNWDRVLHVIRQLENLK